MNKHTLCNHGKIYKQVDTSIAPLNGYRIMDNIMKAQKHYIKNI